MGNWDFFGTFLPSIPNIAVGAHDPAATGGLSGVPDGNGAHFNLADTAAGLSEQTPNLNIDNGPLARTASALHQPLQAIQVDELEIGLAQPRPLRPRGVHASIADEVVAVVESKGTTDVV
jgi:hypothetical protein